MQISSVATGLKDGFEGRKKTTPFLEGEVIDDSSLKTAN